MKELQKKKPTLAQALTPIIVMVVALALGYGVFKIKAEPIIICSAFIAGIIALRLGYTWNDMQKAIQALKLLSATYLKAQQNVVATQEKITTTVSGL